MKTLCPFLLFLILTITSQAQNVTGSYIATETNDTVVSTEWITIDKSETILFSFRMVKHNSQYALELKYNFGAGPVFSVAKGDSVMIKLLSGWTFSIHAKDSIVSKIGLAAHSGSVHGTVTQGVYVVYPLTIGELIALGSEGIEKVRLYTSRGFDNFIFPKSSQNDIEKASVNIAIPVTNWKRVKYMENYHPVTEIPKQKDDKW